MKKLITPDMLIEDLVHEFPELVGPLKDEGIVCLACGEPVWGTLGAQAEEKGITEIDDLVARMNTFLSATELTEN